VQSLLGFLLLFGGWVGALRSIFWVCSVDSVGLHFEFLSWVCSVDSVGLHFEFIFWVCSFVLFLLDARCVLVLLL
jgi:hypothetical protein